MGQEQRALVAIAPWEHLRTRFKEKGTAPGMGGWSGLPPQKHANGIHHGKHAGHTPPPHMCVNNPPGPPHVRCVHPPRPRAPTQRCPSFRGRRQASPGPPPQTSPDGRGGVPGPCDQWTNSQWCRGLSCDASPSKCSSSGPVASSSRSSSSRPNSSRSSSISKESLILSIHAEAEQHRARLCGRGRDGLIQGGGGIWRTPSPQARPPTHSKPKTNGYCVKRKSLIYFFLA